MRLFGLLLTGALLLAGTGRAQVTTHIETDGTLGSAGAQILSGTGGVFEIGEDLGERSGSNLFHSLTRFDVGSGDTAQFTADPGMTTDHIVTRVTGGSTSQIFGTIQSQVSGADLYLMNPSGMIFGAGARIDVDGSFHAGTADVLDFGDGGEFAVDPNAAVTLSSAVPASFGFLSQEVSSITIDGVSLAGTAGETLSFQTRDLRVGETDAATIDNTDGTVELAADTIHLANGSRVSANGTTGHLIARTLDPQGGAGTSLRLEGESILSSNSASGGNAGIVEIRGFESLELLGRSEIQSEETLGGGGNARIEIAVESIFLDERSEISVGAFSNPFNADPPVGGSISIDDVAGTGGVDIELHGGSAIESIGVGGTGGDIGIRAGNILVEGAIIEGDQSQPSSISSTVTSSSGGAGDITIVADEIQLLDGGRISGETLRGGPGGTVSIEAGRIVISGINQELADLIASGALDDITLPANVSEILNISRGEDFAQSAIATGSLSITDVTSGTPQILAASGDAGALSIDVGELRISDGGLISAVSEGPPDAGSIAIRVASLLDLSSGSITTRSSEGLGGNVEIDAAGTVHLLNSNVTTSVASGSGSGGNVLLAAEVAALNGSEIRANADAGSGGNITISADAFIQTPGSLLDASAGPAGVDGQVSIDSPDVNVEAGLAQLPADFLSASSMIRPSCAARAAQPGGSFVVARRKGVAASPDGLLLAFDALDESYGLLAEGEAPLPAVGAAATDAPLVAEVGEAVGTALRGGHFEDAGATFRAAAERHQLGGDALSQAAALRGLAQTQQAMGRYLESAETLRGALELAETSGDRAGTASALGSLGNVYVALGRAEEAEELFSRGIVIAQDAGRPELAATLLSNLGNHQSARQEHAEALRAYEQAARIADETGQAFHAARALASAARAALDGGQGDRAVELLERSASRTRELPRSAARVYLQIHQARTWQRVASQPELRERGLLAAHAALTRAGDLAREIDAPRALSFALGNLGELYEAENRTDEALYLTRAALREAERADAPESEYRWHWQQARLLWSQGRASASVQAYQRAIAILEETRQEAQGRYGEAVAYFRRAVAPVYQELVEVLLASSERTDVSTSEQLLLQARGTVERLKAAELRDYFRDECVAELEAKTSGLDQLAARAAVIYPMVLSERLEILVTLPAGLRRYSVEVDERTLTDTVRRFRRDLMSPGSDAYREGSRSLYDWLIRPFADDVKAAGLDTLVFVPDGPLRTVPMAALHDGEAFLTSRFAIAVTPSVALVDPQPLDRDGVEILLGGISESVDGFPPLAMVPAELEAVQGLYGGDILLDADFRLDRVESEIAESQPSVVHIASHAVFTGDPETSFVLTHDDRLTMERLSNVVGVTRFRERPLELLVLSACETAAGDDRAGLGLAGVAIRAGARSAMGTLWSIADEAAFRVVSEFYRQLKEPEISKAVALQRAQAKLREDPSFQHPYYWSPFLIINNWL